MGPAATASFLARLADVTPAEHDQEHIPTVVYSDPETPDRSDAIFAGGSSPLPAMVRGIEFLERSGSDVIAIPCNSAHYWFADLAGATSVPVIHIVDAVLGRIEHEAPHASAIGVLATEGTVQARIYHERLAASGRDAVDLNDLGPDNPVMACIRAVKSGELERAREMLARATELLVSRGAGGLVSGCTDISTVLDTAAERGNVAVWDSTDALALACVNRLYPDRSGRSFGGAAEGTELEGSGR